MIEENSEQFQKLVKLYQDYNSHTNISAIREEHEIYDKHFKDSLISVPLLKDANHIIDIGTGGGFPAIIIAMALPGSEVVALDSVGKKIKFLEIVKEELKLKNLNPIKARAEELAHDKNYREKFDIAISRAVAELRILVEYSAPFVKAKGQFIAYKKSGIDKELAEAQKAISTMGLKLVSQNQYDSEKQLLILEKYSKTKEIYPRDYAKIKKNPL